MTYPKAEGDMPDPGHTPPARPVHRFVPTLTEVVLPTPAAFAASEPSQPASLITPEILEEITDASIRRAEVVLTQKLPELLAVMLHEQALAVSERLRREIRTVVRESVTVALGEKLSVGRTPPLSADNPPAVYRRLPDED